MRASRTKAHSCDADYVARPLELQRRAIDPQSQAENHGYRLVRPLRRGRLADAPPARHLLRRLRADGADAGLY